MGVEKIKRIGREEEWINIPPLFQKEGEGIAVSTATPANVEVAASSKAELAL